MDLAWALGHPLGAGQYTIQKFARRWRESRLRTRDSREPSYSASCPLQMHRPIFTLAKRELNLAEPWVDLAEKYCRHEFDLLGSGWRSTSRRVEGDWLANTVTPVNYPESRRIWRLIQDGSYKPIHWHRDLKTGEEWPARVWFRDTVLTPRAGSDVKMPWELSRCHHLPQLALAYRMRSDSRLVAEFRHQILDFIAQNPPRFGVNWFYAMDVGIRAANWIVAFDLFSEAGVSFDREFVEVLTRSLYEHGLHIWNYREWHPVIRGNHYLANLAGLIFIGARLNETRWLNEGCAQMEREVARQFLPDGGNFEGSTCYHRLSAEMVGYSSLVLNGFGYVDAGELLKKKFTAMVEFTEGLTNNHGSIAQIGDNDSGRFLKLDNTYRKGPTGWSEVFLDHRHLSHLLPKCRDERQSVDKEYRESWSDLYSRFSAAGLQHKRITRFPLSRSIDVTRTATRSFPHFGAYSFKNPEFTVVIRCGGREADGSGGHQHNDQLALDLEVGGRELVRDPGTLTYTSNPELRNLYRSSRAHFLPRLENEEQGSLQRGLFELRKNGVSECLFMDREHFAGVHFGFSQPVYRLVHIEAQQISIFDWTDGALPLAVASELPAFSDGYGRLESA